MSHIVQVQTQIRDPIALTTACRRLELPVPNTRTVQLFSSQVSGLAVELPSWRCPVVCHTDTGQLEFDNFEGRWGEKAQLDRLLQMYAVEKANPTSPTTWLVSGKRQGLRVFFLTTFRVCEFDLVTEVRACLAESFDVLLDV